MRIAWFTPFARRSAIGQRSVPVLRSLANRADVIVYASAIKSPRDALSAEFDVRPIRNSSARSLDKELDRCDAIFYNLGDHLAFHREIYETCQRHHGIVILHDLVMHHFFAGYFLDFRKDEAGYERELRFAHGEDGQRFARSVTTGTAGYVWDKAVLLEYNMALSAIHGALGVVVHSNFARVNLESRAAAPILRADFPTPAHLGDAVSPDRKPVVASANGRIRLVTFGVVNPNKMVAEVIETIARNPQLRRRVIYDVVGETGHDLAYERRLKGLIADLDLGEVVHLRGYLPDDALYDLVREADLVVNLRNPHFGESSASLVDSIYLGKPTIVWKHGYYAEFPDRVVSKVTSLQSFEKQLERLSTDGELRQRLATEAWSYGRNTFDTERYCDALLGFASECRYNQPVLELVDTVSTWLDELGVGAGSNLTDYVIGTIANFAGVESAEGSPRRGLPEHDSMGLWLSR